MPLLDDLAALLNEHSRENASDTPDFILAGYLVNCLAAFEAATRHRELWYGRPMPGVRAEVNAEAEEVTG